MGCHDLSDHITFSDISLSDFIHLGEIDVDVEADDVSNLDTFVETSISEARFGEAEFSLHQMADAITSVEQGHSVDAKAVAVEILRMLIDLLEQTR